MPFPLPLVRRVLAAALAAAASTAGIRPAHGQSSPSEVQTYRDAAAKYEKEANDHLHEIYVRWQHARSAGKKRLADDVYEAAIRADRPDAAEEAVAGGPLKERQIPTPRRCRDVPLRVVHLFEGIAVDPSDKVADAPNQSNNAYSNAPNQTRWLTRRITPNALEVWTPTHGWLFDGRGRLLNEASSPDGKSMGREWYGAFLPDGRWVTTDVEKPDPDKLDFFLTFFSREGTRLKAVPSAQLATESVPGVPPDPASAGHALLGWARSNQVGTAWVVNVGSEAGFATVQIGPDGPPHPFSGVGRWQACYPRALGPRGYYIYMRVPDDAGGVLLAREEAGHGMYVGYPSYSLIAPEPSDMPDELANGERLCRVPNGNDIFGFWPGRRDVFIGSIRSDKPSEPAPAMAAESADENATWFFTSDGRFRGWLRGRRLADAADGRAMLFRLEDNNQVITLRPDLHTARARRFTWTDGSTAVALSLFDDLRLGLFIRDGKLALAGWTGKRERINKS